MKDLAQSGTEEMESLEQMARRVNEERLGLQGLLDRLDQWAKEASPAWMGFPENEG
jgi:hypothetical protein